MCFILNYVANIFPCRLFFFYMEFFFPFLIINFKLSITISNNVIHESMFLFSKDFYNARNYIP